MIAHAPEAPNFLPDPEIKPGDPTPPEVLKIHSMIDPYAQIERFARVDHGRPVIDGHVDKTGLTWDGPWKNSQGVTWRSNMTFVVRGHHEEDIKKIDPVTGEQAYTVTRERQKLLTGSKDRSHNGHLLRKPWTKKATMLNDRETKYSIDIMEHDSDLGQVVVDTIKLNESELRDYFADAYAKDGLRSVRIEDRPAPSDKPDTIRVRAGKGESNVKAIERELLANDLDTAHGMEGVSLISTQARPASKGEERLEIVEVLSTQNNNALGNGPTNPFGLSIMEPMMRVRIYKRGHPSPRSTPTRSDDFNQLSEEKLMPASAVKKIINGADATTADLQIRYNQGEVNGREWTRMLGRRALRRSVMLDPVTGKRQVYAIPHPDAGRAVYRHGQTPFRVGNALAIFAGIDMVDPSEPETQEAFERRSKKLIEEHPMIKEYAESLEELSQWFGSDNLVELAQRIDKAYHLDAKRIGLPLEPRSIDWVMLDMAEQFYWSRRENRGKVPQSLRGVESGQPWNYTEKAEKRQQEFIDRRIGQKLDEALLGQRPVNPHRGADDTGALKITPVDSSEWAYLGIDLPYRDNSSALIPGEVVDSGGTRDIRTVKHRFKADYKPHQYWDKLKIDTPTRNGIWETLVGALSPQSQYLSYKDHVRIGKLLRKNFSHAPH